MAVLFLLSGGMLSGCGMRLGGWFAASRFGEEPCRLPKNLSKQQLVAHLNHTIHRVRAWRATNVEINAGMPVPLSADLAVERPRQFRLRARSSFTGSEVDLGSNDQRFWFWTRRSPQKGVFTATHENVQKVQQMTGVPFQPEWLIEVLGVIPLNPDEYLMQPEPNDTGIVSLVSERVNAAGYPVRRVILVDTCHGRIVAHELYDRRNVLIARAELNRYAYDRATGIAMPRQIHLDWPQAGMAMTMNLRAIEINPAGMPEHMWKLPQIRGNPVIDLGRLPQPGNRPGRARVSSLPDGSSPSQSRVRPAGSDDQPPAALSGELEVTAEAPPRESPSRGWRPRQAAGLRTPVSPRNRRSDEPFQEEPPWSEEPPWEIEERAPREPADSSRIPRPAHLRRPVRYAPGETPSADPGESSGSHQPRRRAPQTLLDALSDRFSRLR